MQLPRGSDLVVLEDTLTGGKNRWLLYVISVQRLDVCGKGPKKEDAPLQLSTNLACAINLSVKNCVAVKVDQ